MPFEPGNIANPNGRPPGPSKSLAERRAKIQRIVDTVLDDQASINELLKMKDKDKWDIITKLLQYSVHKLEPEIVPADGGSRKDFISELKEQLERTVS